MAGSFPSVSDVKQLALYSSGCCYKGVKKTGSILRNIVTNFLLATQLFSSNSYIKDSVMYFFPFFDPVRV